MRLRMIALLPLLLVTGLAGCGKDEKVKMGKYHYHLDKINKRWDVVRKNFQTEKPNIFYGVVLKKDFDELVTAMQRTYKGSNRDEVLPKLKELAKKFKVDIDAMVDIRFGTTKLMPGATIEGVGEVIEKTYAEFQEIEKLLK